MPFLGNKAKKIEYQVGSTAGSLTPSTAKRIGRRRLESLTLLATVENFNWSQQWSQSAHSNAVFCIGLSLLATAHVWLPPPPHYDVVGAKSKSSLIYHISISRAGMDDFSQSIEASNMCYIY